VKGTRTVKYINIEKNKLIYEPINTLFRSQNTREFWARAE